MAYTSPSLATVRAALSRRLADPTFARWIPAELDRYIREALRTWNALTQTQRDRDTFQSTLTHIFYDLPTVLPALRAQTLTDRDLILDLEYTLLEPPTGIWSPATWTGSQQFALTDLTQAIQRRRDQFLLETAAVITRVVVQAPPPPVDRVVIPETVMQIRRLAWRSVDGIITPLLLTDDYAIQQFQTQWPQQPSRPPIAYAVAATPPLTVQLAPPPFDAGTMDLLAVHTGAALDATIGVPLGIPDDFAWVVKFGALADLLSRDGLAYDPQRAAYAEQMWQTGIAAARSAAVVLAVRINNQPVRLGSLSEADRYSPWWQTIQGNPSMALTMGQTLIALLPPVGVPIGGGDYSITLDVVRNMPVPIANADPIQLGGESLDILLDYAQYLALWKEGPTQVEAAAQSLLTRFGRMSEIAKAVQQATQPSRRPLLGQTTQDVQAVTPQQPVVPIGE